MIDCIVWDQGTITLVIPTSPEGVEWLDEHVGHGEDTTWLSGSLAVEHGYIDDLVRGMIDDGLELQQSP